MDRNVRNYRRWLSGGEPLFTQNPKEQAQSALEAWRAGASVMHIHARDPETGKVSHNVRFYEEAILPIKGHSDVIIKDDDTGHPWNYAFLYYRRYNLEETHKNINVPIGLPYVP